MQVKIKIKKKKKENNIDGRTLYLKDSSGTLTLPKDSGVICQAGQMHSSPLLPSS